MKTKPLTFRTVPIEWRDTSAWRAADLAGLDEDGAERFNRYAAAIALYLRGGRLKDAAAAAGCSPPNLIQQLNRCLSLQVDGQVLGWPGLIEGLRIKEYERQVPLPIGTGAAVDGSPGAFKKFLAEHPKVKGAIDTAILKGLGTKRVRSLKSTQKGIWKLFLEKVGEERIPADAYPLNSTSRGRRSVERYVKHMLDTDPKTVRTWCGIEAAKALQVGNGRFSFDFAVVPFDLVGADAHELHCVGTITINGPAGPQRVPVRRIWIYAVGDFGSRAVIGYAASVRQEPNAAMLEQAFDMSQRPWVKRELKMPGVRYREGAGFPCGSVDGLTACRPVAVRLDNGMPGYSNAMVRRIKRKLGCAVTFGAIGAWWHNHVIERINLQLEQCGFECSPSATGSNANDPMRGDPVAEALKHGISAEDLLDLVDVAFANYNAEPQAGLGHRSPLEVLRDQLDPHNARMQPGLPVPPTVTTPDLGVVIETRIVRGKRGRGHYRRAYVQVDKYDYTNDELSHHLDWVNTPLTLHITEADLRTVKAFLPTGQPIGELVVLHRGWRRTKHSREDRKSINRLRDSGELPDSSDDFMGAYMKYLAGKAAADARQRPGKISKAASDLAEVVRTSGERAPQVEVAPHLRLVPPPARPVPRHVKRPSWE